MSRGGGDDLKQIRAKNFILYFQIFHRYIQDFKKDINILFYEMKNLERMFFVIKENNMTKSASDILNLFNQILNETNISTKFKSYLENLSIFYNI